MRSGSKTTDEARPKVKYTPSLENSLLFFLICAYMFVFAISKLVRENEYLFK